MTYTMKLMSLKCLLLLPLCFLASVALGKGTDDRSAFQNVSYVQPPSIIVPTVVEVPLNPDLLSNENFLVYEVESDRFIPWYLRWDRTIVPTTYRAHTNEGNKPALVDSNWNTYVDFELPTSRFGTVVITITGDKPITASSFFLGLADNVIYPTAMSIRVRDANGSEKIVVSRAPMYSDSVSFPQTTGTEWTVELEYSQLLRISEVRLVEDQLESTIDLGLRLLAQPGYSYQIYQNSDRFVSPELSEEGNLLRNKDVLVLKEAVSSPNPLFVEADVDGDGVSDWGDNCPDTHNPDQSDVNRNGEGDACEDFDRDGIYNSIDNCTDEPNRNQADEDGDGIGDVCDREESRFTERYTWVPWVGMGIAGVVILGLFVLVARGPKPVTIEKKSEGNE